MFRICLHDKAGPGACRLASNYARPNSVALTIPASAGTGAYSYSYDVNGRISQVTYPSGFKADYNYTQLGYATQIVDGTLFTPYWTANTRDAELHLTQSTAGNGVVTNESFDGNTGRLLGLCATPDAGTCDGATANFAYTWDVIGNLKTRSDANDSVSETYCYDVLNRLTNSATGTGGATPSSCTASGTGIIDKIIGYDAAGLGNIASKSDVGTYSYGSGAGPHAVTAITGSYLGLTNPVLGYDANGNMTCVSSASSCGGTVARSVSYTSFNMAGSIVQGGATIGLSYDSEHNRVVQTQGSTTTTYLNDPVSGAMSEAVTSGGTTVWRDYIVADGGIVALRTTSPATGTATNWGDTTNAIWGNSSFKWYGTGVSVLYFTTDHLGSTSVLTDPSHVVQERDSYDAWGRRRNSNGTDNAACSITSLTTRGFTGQEMMDTVCAINLNARIYDPTIARMMLADPTIPNPMNGQSYNRYSYVNNRPLSATDPTGYWTLPGGATGTGPISNISLKYGVSQFGGLGSAGAIYGMDATLCCFGYSAGGDNSSAVGAALEDLIGQQLADAGLGSPPAIPIGSTSVTSFGSADTSNQSSGGTAEAGNGGIDGFGGPDAEPAPPQGATWNPSTSNYVLPDGSTWVPTLSAVQNTNGGAAIGYSGGFQAASFTGPTYFANIPTYGYDQRYGTEIGQGTIGQNMPTSLKSTFSYPLKPGDRITILASSTLSWGATGGVIVPNTGDYQIISPQGVVTSGYIWPGTGSPVVNYVSLNPSPGLYEFQFSSNPTTISSINYQVYVGSGP